MPLPSHTNFRLRGIPLHHEKKDNIRQLVKQTLDLGSTAVINIHSLAVSPSDNTSKVATLSFLEIPTCFLDQPKDEWTFHLEDGEDFNSIVFDTHFRGFTPFQRAKSDDCHVDIIAVTGLGGHALGSFKQKDGPFVWLRDGLPVDAPNARILSYGYDTKIVDSRSFQSLTDLAKSLQIDLERIQVSGRLRPIVFIAHSLGGLLVKETIVHIAQEPAPFGRSMLDLLSAFMFFGVPHQGLAVECLVPMVKDSPNRALLESLGKNSPLLSRLQREFSGAIGAGCLQVVAFYETERSLTARQVPGGRWEMSGPSEVLVEVSSANCGSVRQYPINRNHSEMVKFTSREDNVYQRVIHALKPLLVESQTVRGTRHNPSISLSEDEKSCLRSLSFQEQDHRNAELRYYKDTCEWLLEDKQYQAWLKSPRGLFWIKGSPGTGKSVLMKFAVGAMQRRHSIDLVVSFFIHGRGVLLQRTPLGLLRALLSSLLESFPTYLQKLTKRFKYQEERFGGYERKDGWVWTESELEELLSEVLVQGTKAHPVAIYVDALDECGEHDAKKLLQYFRNIMSMVEEEQGLVKICFSSRHYPILELETIPTLFVEEKNGKDIRLVVKNLLDKLSLREKRHEIEKDILSKAQGGFQWAILVTDIIRDGVLRRLNSASLLHAVAIIPETLQDLYQTILCGVEGEERAQMVKLFQWVLFSERPLSAHELREAITTSQGMTCTTSSELRVHPNFSDTISDFEFRVRYISRGLVEFQSREVWEIYETDGEDWDREAQFIHQSAADFIQQNFLIQVDFASDSQHVGAMGNFEISRSCLRYLALQDILESSQLSRRELSVKFPLLPYAVTFLLRHIALVEQCSTTQNDLLELFQWHQPDRLRMFSSLWLKMDPDCMHAPVGWPFLSGTAPHILVAIGSLSALQIYLNHNTIKFDSKDSDGNTPLLLALREGREDLALLLLDLSTKLKAGQTPSDPGQRGEEADFLSHVNITNGDGETPLGMAVSTTAHGAIHCLLAAGADPTTERGLLFYAIGHSKPLLLNLIERKACLDGAVFFAVQSLQASSSSDHEKAVCDILSILLNAGANTRKVSGVMDDFNLPYPDDEDDEDEDEEAIIFATRYGLVSAVKFLINLGVPPVVGGYFPLQIAVDFGHSEMVEVLSKASLESGDLTEKNIKDLLFDAIRYGATEVATILLKNIYGDGVPSDILTRCVKVENLELTRFILQPKNGIKSTTDDWPESTLQLALDWDDVSSRMALMLLKMWDIDLFAEGDDGVTPFRRCLSQGRRDMVRLILKTGKVDIHKNDKDGESPFWWTMRKGDNNVIELLLRLAKGNIHVKDWTGRTAYWWLTEGRPHERGRVAIAEAALRGNLLDYTSGRYFLD